MRLQLEIAVTQTGSGFQATVSGVKSVETAVNNAGGAGSKFNEAIDKIAGKGNPFSVLTKGSDEIMASMLKTVSVVALFEKGMEGIRDSVEWVKEAIGHADFIRDLNLSLTAYTKSAETATKVIAYFNAEQIHTRNTAEELQQSFRNLEPLASTKGFTIGAQQQITVMLSQVATAADKSLSEIEAGYRRVLSGVVGGASRNALLQVLGISADQLKNMGWDEFLAKLREASERSAAFGQSWESTMHKASDSLKNAFAEGFNEARGSAVEGMDAITAVTTDPVIRTALHDLGVETAEWAGKLGGVITELRGIAAWLKSLDDDPFWQKLQTITGHGVVPHGGLLGLLGETGNAQLAAQQATADAAASAAAGRAALVNTGILPDPMLRLLMGAKGVPVQPADIGNFKSIPTLQKFIGDLAVENKVNADTMRLIEQAITRNRAEAIAAKRPFNAEDITSAFSDVLNAPMEGAPSGLVSTQKGGKDKTDELKIQTAELLAQAGILDIERQTKEVQARIDQETAAITEKKTGLENIQLDSITKQLLAQRDIDTLHKVDLDYQREKAKALAEYQKAIGEIDKQQAEDATKPGGAKTPAAAFDAKRSAETAKYGKELGKIDEDHTAALIGQQIAQTKLSDTAKTTVLDRTKELQVIRELVAAQRDQVDIVTDQLTKAHQAGELAAIELALQNQRVNFGGVVLSQQAESLLKQHEALILQQTANDTEIAMQEERKRYEKERAATAAKLAAEGARGFKGIDDITGLAVVNPAINQLTLLIAQQRAGEEAQILVIQAKGADAMMAAHQRARDYQVQTVDILLKGYSQIADLMNSAANDAVTALVSGNAKGAFKNLADDFRRMMVGEITDIIKPFIARLSATAQGKEVWDPNAVNPITGAAGMMVTPSAGQQQTAQRVMAGAQGAAALYSIYQQGQAGASKEANAISGIVTGAAAGAVAGPWGLVIGALVGGVVGFLSGKNKAKFTVSVSGGKISITGSGEATMADVNASLSAINSQIAAASASVWQIFDAFPIAIAQTLQHLNPADILKDGVLGALSPFTSQTTLGKLFDLDPLLKRLRSTVKGMQGGLTGDELKNFIQNEVPKLYLDAFTPVIQGGLAALGVTDAKIKSLFDASATQDPTVFFKFITDYITGFVAMKNTIDFLGKTSQQKTGVAAALASPDLTDQLAKANENIAYLGQGLDQLTNTDQVERLKQINAAIATRYQLEIQELNDIANARRAVSKSYLDLEHGFAMSVASQQQQIVMLLNQRDIVAASLNDQVSRTRQLIAGAKTPAEVTAIADAYAQLTQQIYNAAKSLRDSFQSILDSFTALDAQKLADVRATLSPSAQLAAIANQAAGISGAFAGMSDADKIANSQKLIQLAQEYYNIQKQALTDLGNAAKSIHESVQKQIFGIQFDQLAKDPQAQIEMLLQQQRTLYASLATATTADQINQIVAEIQGNVTTVSGLEGNTPQAAADAIKALQEADKAAQDQIAALTAQAKANDDAMAAAQKNLTDSITTTIGELNTLMTNATNDLIAFGVLIQNKLTSFVDIMTTSDAALLAILQPVFDALGNTTADATVSVGNFGNALDGAADRLRHFPIGIGSNSTPQGSFSTPTSTTSTVSFSPQISIDISGPIAPFVSMVRVVANEEIDRRKIQDARFARSSEGL